MSNKSRQPRVETATGNPDRGKSAAVIANAGNNGKALGSKPLEQGKPEGNA